VRMRNTQKTKPRRHGLLQSLAAVQCVAFLPLMHMDMIAIISMVANTAAHNTAFVVCPLMLKTLKNVVMKLIANAAFGLTSVFLLNPVRRFNSFSSWSHPLMTCGMLYYY
jgi:hypothetical protein